MRSMASKDQERQYMDMPQSFRLGDMFAASCFSLQCKLHFVALVPEHGHYMQKIPCATSTSTILS